MARKKKATMKKMTNEITDMILNTITRNMRNVSDTDLLRVALSIQKELHQRGFDEAAVRHAEDSQEPNEPGDKKVSLEEIDPTRFDELHEHYTAVMSMTYDNNEILAERSGLELPAFYEVRLSVNADIDDPEDIFFTNDIELELDQDKFNGSTDVKEIFEHWHEGRDAYDDFVMEVRKLVDDIKGFAEENGMPYGDVLREIKGQF